MWHISVLGWRGGVAVMSAVLERLRAMDARRGAQSERDAELQGMLDAFDLLGMIQADTGEQGHASGDYIAFHTCPVCGHSDDFVFYPETNSWTCFSDSNTSGFAGGTAIDYLQATGRARDNAEAVKLLREATGNARKTDKEKSKGATPRLLLPRWQGVQAANPPKRRPCLIDGVLRRGHVGLFSGRAKVGKSWLGLQLLVAVACGVPWLGFEVARGNVLMLDPELDTRSLDGRFAKVCAAMGVDASEADRHITRWSLRGVRKADGNAPTLEDVAHDLRELERCGELPQLDLVFVDSMAALMDGDENAARDVRRNFNTLLEIAETTGASVMCSHHQGKGNGDRSAADRARGSSVFTDAPDVVFSLDEIQPPSGEASDYLPDGARALCLTCAGIREFAPFPDVHLIYQYPTHTLDVDGITADWKPKSSQQKAGRASGQSRKDAATLKRLSCEVALLAHFQTHGIGAEGVTAKEAAAICSEALGKSVNGTTLKRLFEDEPSASITVYQKSARRCYFVPTHLPHA